MMCGSNLGFIYYIHEFRRRSGNLAGNFWNIFLPIVCYVQINYSISFFLLYKSSMMVNITFSNGNDDFDCLNTVSSWRCGLWCLQSSQYLLHCPWIKLLFSDPRNLVGRPGYMTRSIFFCDRALDVAVALLLIRYMRIASIVYGSFMQSRQIGIDR